MYGRKNYCVHIWTQFQLKHFPVKLFMRDIIGGYFESYGLSYNCFIIKYAMNKKFSHIFRAKFDSYINQLRAKDFVTTYLLAVIKNKTH